MKYRPEVDGLRAVAVLPVIFFHAGFSGFAGGYVGVDVFFVISGYLITIIIYDELVDGRFSILRFYERRARRIIPALFLVSATSAIFAWMWMLDWEFRLFSQSLVGVGTFTSNIVFWRDTGYFAEPSEFKPLLHTWSLAIEEQFYILFPLLMMLLFRFPRAVLMGCITLAVAASLLVAQYASVKYPSANFFLLPTRAWELGVGVLAALWLRGNPQLGGSWLRETGGLLGLAMIGYSVFAFDDATPFPGFWALMPVGGTALIILAAGPSTSVGRLLSWAPLVTLGLISYSAYLWHQPLFVFARILKADDGHSPILFVSLSIIALILAWLSWRFVEMPFRRMGVFSRRTIFSGSLAALLTLIVIGLIGWYSAPRQETTLEFTTPASPFTGTQITPDTMLLGDSHAAHLLTGLELTLGERFERRTTPSCTPFLNVDRYDFRFEAGTCVRNVNAALDEFMQSPELRNIIIGTMGPVYIEETTFRGKDTARVTGSNLFMVDNPAVTDNWQIFEIGMRRTLELLTSQLDKNVIFVIDNPELGIHPRKCDIEGKVVSIGDWRLTIREPANLGCRIPVDEYLQRAGEYRRMVKQVVADFPQVKLVDPMPLFCDGHWCYGTRDGRQLYRDWDHLSPYGSWLVAQDIAPLLIDPPE